MKRLGFRFLLSAPFLVASICLFRALPCTATAANVPLKESANSSTSASANTGRPSEQNIFDENTLAPFNGLVIQKIEVHGLARTRESAVTALLSFRPGDAFKSSKWIEGIHKLYNTQVLYNIRTDIKRDPLHPRRIFIDLSLSDRWTILPFGTAQAGGGSFSIGGGIADMNLFGGFTKASLGYSEFDHLASYDFNLFQEFIGSSNYIAGLDISQVGNPVTLQQDNGESLGKFTWKRSQQQLLTGYKFGQKIRLLGYLEFYRDNMVSNEPGAEVQLYDGTQYRVRPRLIIGRSELTNFLEEGYELSVAPSFANFFDQKKSYSRLGVSYKRVQLIGNSNFAYVARAGAMSAAPIPYLFRLGGYDSVRGFTTNRALGQYFVVNNLEYRPYLFRLRLPLIGDVIAQGNLFQDSGIIWNSSDLSKTRRVNSRLILLSHGLGVRLNFLRFAGSIIRLDVARTAIPNEGWGMSFGVGQFF